MADGIGKVKGLLMLLIPSLLAANILIYRSVFTPGQLEVHTLPTSKGTVVLLKTSMKKTVLIDTGPDAGIVRVLGETLPEWQRHIDQIILTSPIQAASGGLPEIQSRYSVGNVAHLPVTGKGSAEIRKVLRITYGATSLLVDENNFLLEKPNTSDLVISSSTSVAVYYSDGQVISQP